MSESGLHFFNVVGTEIEKYQTRGCVMPHDKYVMENVLNKLRITYPPDRYLYELERSTAYNRRMMPDVIVYDRQGEIVCVAEIGYTNPHKLRAYRDSYKFADVRWFDKYGEEYNFTDKETRDKVIMLEADVEAVMQKLTSPMKVVIVKGTDPPPVEETPPLEDIQFELCVHKEIAGAFHCEFLYRCTDCGCPNYTRFGGLQASLRAMNGRATGTDYDPIERYEKEIGHNRHEWETRK